MFTINKTSKYCNEDNYLNKKRVITNMFIVDWLKQIFKKPEKTQSHTLESIYFAEKEEIEEIHSLWDYIKLIENTQASHISGVVGFDEWVPMEEILRRIKEVFGVEYKNNRSLYPYIKTLADIGLLETNSVGGRKKWRKKDVLIKIKAKKEEKETEKESVKAQN